MADPTTKVKYWIIISISYPGKIIFHALTDFCYIIIYTMNITNVPGRLNQRSIKITIIPTIYWKPSKTLDPLNNIGGHQEWSVQKHHVSIIRMRDRAQFPQ